MIIDYEIKELEKLDYHTGWKIMENDEKIVLTDKFQIDILELLKIKEKI